MKRLLTLVTLTGLCAYAVAQNQTEKNFTLADTLRGSITPERAWWDAKRYDLTIKPEFSDKTTQGDNLITYKVVSNNPGKMQLDLQVPLHIDSAILLDDHSSRKISNTGNVWYIDMPKQSTGRIHQIQVYFSGNPHIAVRPPWDGGWSFSLDSLNNPWMTVCCQGLGASVWYPCKDHQSDEPDEGASLSMTVPDSLQAIGSGRLTSKTNHPNKTSTYKWEVINPISNYCIIPYIGKYSNITDTYIGEKGRLDLSFWPLSYHSEKANPYFADESKKMLQAFEYWFGPYPFYEDSYKLVEADNTGMEHQSNIGYGNYYAFGYRGRDGSGTRYGLKSDFIVVHESAHEWWGNSLTSNDLADMWVHESFANYAEALYAEYHFGKKAGNDYCFGTRRGIGNWAPVIPAFNVNAQGSGDMYPKGGNMLHAIRHSMGSDSLFRSILRGLQRDYYHQTIDGTQLIDYFCNKTDYDYHPVFDQYLKHLEIPQLNFYFEGNKVYYKWSNCIPGFNLPIHMSDDHQISVKFYPTETWKSSEITAAQKALLASESLEYMYYIKAVEGK